MKIYEVSGLREYWNIVTMSVKAADEKAAKAKFRKRVNGPCTGLRVTLKLDTKTMHLAPKTT